MIATVAGGKVVASNQGTRYGLVLGQAADLAKRGYVVWLREVKGSSQVAELRKTPEGGLALTYTGPKPVGGEEPEWVSKSRRYLSNTEGACA